MAKIKKKLAEKVTVRKNDKNKKTLNPFEIHINKQKYQVLGQKGRNDRGLPGVSRAKALKKRKRTLLPEYNIKNKSNKFLDRRIGEKNTQMTDEDRAMARFTAERLRNHSKKSIFNLADDEILTHRGQTLNEIEKFDDPRSDDDDDDDDDRVKRNGKLDDSFVGDAHFGGGILKKTDKEGAKSYKDLIDQLIVESKKRKAEKQKTKEQTLELTEKLDKEWQDLMPLVNKTRRTEEDKAKLAKEKPDDYDRVMRELIFEARGNPTDRLKSEDEIAKEEKEKLEKLEKDRLNRMQGFTETQNKTKQHRSADDLDDNFNYDSDPEITIAYDDEGKLKSNLEHLTSNGKDGNVEDEANDQEDENEAENDDDDEEDEDSSEAETEDDLSDLKEDESDSDLEEEEEVKPAVIETNKTSKNERKRKLDESNSTMTKSEIKPKAQKIEPEPIKIKKIENEPIKIKKIENEPVKSDPEPPEPINETVINEMIEKAKKELPYTYKLPDSYETLQSLLSKQPPEYQDVIIDRMIKCNHPSLGAENKENLGRLFVYLLQHLNDVAPDSSETDIENVKHCFSVLNSLMPHLFSLTQMSPQNSRDSLIEVIKEKQSEYKKTPKTYPGLDVLVFLKVVSCLFSTSDFRHQLVTPSLVFMNQMLTNCRIKTRYDIAYGLFLVTLFAEYTTLSKRFMPSAIIYLMGIVHMAIPKLGVKLIKILRPFKSNCAALVLPSPNKKNYELKMHVDDFICDKEIDDSFKIRVLYTSLKLTEELYEYWTNLSSHVIIFEHFYKLLNMIPKENYPKEIQDTIVHLQNIYANTKENLKIEYIVYEKKKPKALRLYEPNIQKVYDGKRFKPMSKEKAQREKLVHKYKKEMKGALREIRRDKSFLGRVKIKQQIQSDTDRREKVKQIYAEASIQQSELNALDRKKKRK